MTYLVIYDLLRCRRVLYFFVSFFIISFDILFDTISKKVEIGLRTFRRSRKLTVLFFLPQNTSATTNTHTHRDDAMYHSSMKAADVPAQTMKTPTTKLTILAAT
jgi:hypothetical protein